MASVRPTVTVVGGGIAALELVLALHDRAPGRLDVTVVSPHEDFSLPPLSIAAPYGLGPYGELRWADVMAELGGRFLCTSVTKADPRRGQAYLHNGEVLPHDALVLVPGAVATPALASSITLDPTRPGSIAAIGTAIERGWSRSVAFVVPPGVTWPLPLYELALLVAAQVRDRYGVALHLITPEPAPLAVFGATASAAVADRLADAGIIFHGDVAVRMAGWGALDVGAAMPLVVDHIVAAPVLGGPGIAGIPADPSGFIPVDRDGAVVGLDRVWAAGDGTDQPVKQGGIACQQADRVAEGVAHALAGAPPPDEPAPLVLRARLLTGDADDLYLRHTLGQDDGEAATEPLWSPPAKVVGEHLPRYLERHGISDRGTAAVG